MCVCAYACMYLCRKVREKWEREQELHVCVCMHVSVSESEREKEGKRTRTFQIKQILQNKFF